MPPSIITHRSLRLLLIRVTFHLRSEMSQMTMGHGLNTDVDVDDSPPPTGQWRIFSGRKCSAFSIDLPGRRRRASDFSTWPKEILIPSNFWDFFF